LKILAKFRLIFFLVLFTASSAFADADIFTAASVGALSSVEEALSTDFNVNSADIFGNTALLLASENGHLQVVKLLIKRGADVNRQNIYGYSPLLSAVINAHPGVIRELLAGGADIKLENMFSTSAADYIASLGYKNAEEYISALTAETSEGKTGPNSLRYLALNKAPPVIEPSAQETGDNDSAVSDNISEISETDVESLYLEGKKLTDGISPQDAVLGNEYLQKAYALGDIRAAVLIGRSYLMGYALPTDFDKALEFFDLGLLKGDEDAKFFIGAMKYFGIGLPENKAEGFIEISSAAAGGSVYAQEQLKSFVTEDMLDYLREPRAREDIKTFMLSMGATLTDSEGFCDLYDLKDMVNKDYALTKAKICSSAPDSKHVIFEYLKDIDPLYKAGIDRYIEAEGFALIVSE
jgi:TPR repeat protein